MACHCLIVPMCKWATTKAQYLFICTVLTMKLYSRPIPSILVEFISFKRNDGVILPPPSNHHPLLPTTFNYNLLIVVATISRVSAMEAQKWNDRAHSL